MPAVRNQVYSEMKLDTDMCETDHNSYFDELFSRAELLKDQQPPQQYLYDEGSNRRGSLQLPTHTLKVESSGVRRAGSCKYPSPRRRGSNSPREPSASPRPRRSSQLEAGLSQNYITEATLRAPSPSCEFKCHSAPQSRSSSWKKMKRPKSARDLVELEGRPRAGSITLDSEEAILKLETLKLLQSEDICPVRNFTSSSRGLVNRGDSFKRRSNASLASDAGSNTSAHGGECHVAPNRNRSLSTASQDSGGAGPATSAVRVLLMGPPGVGKTALMQQFLTSDYMGAADTSFDDDSEKTVTVLLDGEETTIDFIIVQAKQFQRNCFADIDAFVLVYSLTDKTSYIQTRDIIREIKRECRQKNVHPAIILVANKSDNVRTRQIAEQDGKEIALANDSKYIEVSAVLNHKVDELLVGIVRQIRLHPKRLEVLRKNEVEQKETCSKGLLGRLFKSKTFVSKSCDNLMVV